MAELQKVGSVSVYSDQDKLEWRLDPTVLSLHEIRMAATLAASAVLHRGRSKDAELEFSEWVLRRVEKVQFEQDRSVSRRISIELTVRPAGAVRGRGWYGKEDRTILLGTAGALISCASGRPHGFQVTGGAFSPDEPLASSRAGRTGPSGLGTPPTTGNCSPSGSALRVHCVAFSSDGRHVGRGRQVRVRRRWSGLVCFHLMPWPAAGEQIRLLAFSPDGTKLAAGASAVLVYDVATGRELYPLMPLRFKCGNGH